MNQQKRHISVLALGMLVFLVGNSRLLPLKATEVNQPASVNFTDTDYVLGPGDRLRLDIFQVQEYSGDYIVLVDGSVTLPLIGRLPVAGLTLEAMSEAVSQAYSNYLKRPIVTVSLVQPRSLKIAVAGEVANPGSYAVNFQENQNFPTVTDLIQMAGGLTTLANIRQVEIYRNTAQGEKIITVDLWELINQGNLNQDITLRDGDRLIIPSQSTLNSRENQQLADVNFGIQAREPLDITIIGEVYRPGVYEVSPEENTTTGKSEPPNLSAAIAKAGGIKPLANIREIEIHRINRAGETQVIPVDFWKLLQEGDIDHDILLAEGDKIIIPTASQVNSEETTAMAAASFAPDSIQVKVVGEVNTPGSVTIPPNTPLNQAILAAGGFKANRANQNAVELIRLNPDGTVSRQEIDVDFTQNLDEISNPPLRHEDVVVVKTSGGAQAIDTLTTIFSPLRILPIWPFFR